MAPTRAAKAATGPVRQWGATMSSGELQTVTVMTEPAPTVLGGMVNAVVTITGEPDRKVRGAKAQLVRTAIHRITQTNGSTTALMTPCCMKAVVIAEVPVISSGGPVTPGEHVVSLHIPADGLPSATDQVKWSVRAVIDRRHGTDIQAESPIEVLAARSASPARRPLMPATRASAASTLNYPPARRGPARPLRATSSCGQRGR